MMIAPGTFERVGEQNQLDAEAVRERWIRLKSGLP